MKIPILKEFERFEWFEWFEWFGPSPIEPFNPTLNPEVRAQFGCGHGRNGFHRIQSVSSTAVSRFNYAVGINGRTPEYPQIMQERFKKVLKEYSS